MRVYYPLLCYYPSQAGGPANTLYWLNKAMGASGQSTSVIISTKYGLKSAGIDNEALFTKFNIDAEFVDGSLFPFLTWKSIRKLTGADAIHFSSLFFQPTLFLLLIGLISKKKIMISPRGELYDSAL